MIKRLAAIAVVVVLLGGACSLVPPPQGPSYGALAAGGEDCTGYDLASMVWTGFASAAAGLAVAGAAVLPALDDYPDAVLGVSITDAVLGVVAATAALMANETASRYTRCAEGGP
jgi:hypothetical protein